MKRVIGKFFCLLAILIFISTSFRAFLCQFTPSKITSSSKEVHFQKKTGTDAFLLIETEAAEESDTEEEAADCDKLVKSSNSSLSTAFLSIVIDNHFDRKEVIFSQKTFKPSFERWKKNSQFII
jgi:regulator of sirC expression with transglutaminase-like and TPR domain